MTPPCACPRRDAYACADFRGGADLRALIDGEEPDPDREPCGCLCHDEEEDHEEDVP